MTDRDGVVRRSDGLMRIGRRTAFGLVAALWIGLAVSASPVLAQSDPLSSWNDGATKAAIVDFVAKVTTEGGPDFVPPEQRIATFDNDGTLWAEQPFYFQGLFAFDEIRRLAPQHPAWKETEPFKSVLAGDMKGLAATGEKGLVEIVTTTHGGMTTEAFAGFVADWLASARHPTKKVPYDHLVYQPQLELLEYLRANGFKTFIVSGGGVEFMRVFADRAYGIPPEQVVGSSGVVKFELDAAGKPQLLKEQKIEFIDDGPGKPVGINRFIGRRPILAFGNSDGDQQMLQYTAAGDGARFMAILHHTDAEREWAYDRKSHIGKLDKTLDEAAAKGWTVVDMKRDWKTVFPQLIAIDVLLQPGLKMVQAAAAWNVRMRQQNPQGFELDAEHAPHITLLQSFVSTADLDEVLAAVNKVKSSVDIAALEMTATGLYHIPVGEIGVAGIVIEPSEELLALQQAVIDAIAPFAKTGGAEAAFVPDASGAPFDPLLFKYVENFASASSGDRFNPHVTVGIAPLAWLETLEAQPFASFKFGVDGIATYQLGNFGTASRRLDAAE